MCGETGGGSLTHGVVPGKTPVLVGGTLYYLQAVLWPSLMEDEECECA